MMLRDLHARREIGLVSIARLRSHSFLAGLLVLLPLLLALARADTVASFEADDARAPVDLAFRDFYQLPVGPLGLEPTERLLALNGRRVRIQGYVVQEEDPFPGLFLMTPTPVALAERADGPADYLPGATVFVHLHGDDARHQHLLHRPGVWTAVGTLGLGGREELDGRHSYVRLVVDDLSVVRDSTGQMARLSAAAPAGHHHDH